MKKNDTPSTTPLFLILSIIACSLLSSCSSPKHTATGSKYPQNSYCEQLQRNLIMSGASTQPGVAGSPLTQARLLQQYKSSGCKQQLEDASARAPSLGQSKK